MSAVPSPNWPWPAAWAPQWLDQRFNNGWTFGNVIQVTNRNSSQPDVERDVVGQHSYGRQLGRLMDAVVALSDAVAKAQPGVAKDERVKSLRELAQDIDKIKAEAKQRRYIELLDELKALKKHNPEGWAELVKSVGV